ncbi:GAF domain-containing protein [Rhizobiales bacterium GAS191]|nr:GAF domain-containing protein [Rhizobiales bacterium GAS113]SEC98597.1 GAF domain-containing protein [Rhizobiales bacterium GAS191]
MLSSFSQFWSEQSYIPHGVCLLWQPGLLWLHVLSDAVIAIAYYTIPLMLIYFVSRRHDLEFRGIFILTGVFILACGTTHIMGVVTLWYPAYWIDGTIKLATALVSICTAFAMWQAMPLALALPSTEQLERANGLLEHEIGERHRAEAALRDANGELERRVTARTAELETEGRARKRAQDEIERALAFERLLAEISTSLLGTLQRDITGAIRTALQTIAEFLGAERAALWRLGTGGTQFEPTHTWVASGIVSLRPLAVDERLPWIVARIAQGDIVSLPKVDGTLAEFTPQKRTLRQMGAQSLLMVPLALDDATIGAVSLDTVSVARVWPEALLPRLRLIGEIFGSLLVRQRAAEQVGEAKFETGQFRERLAHLVRVRTAGEMSVAIAHEISQPLVAIKNYALAARRRLPTGNALETAKVEKLMDKISAQASRAGEVIHSLRAMVKMHQSEATMVEVGQLVASTLRLVEMEKRIADIRLEVAAEPDLSPVFADAIQIQQVVLNLAHNAIEAMEAAGMTDGVLKVGVMGTTENEVLVSVADSGPGIAADDLEHIFDSFYSTKPQGLGVGLSISRSIVEAHGGRLSLASNASSGSVFQFTLPIANEGG